MQSHYLFLALDLAQERADEARRERLARQARPASSGVGPVRRVVARFAVAIARAADERAVPRTQVASN